MSVSPDWQEIIALLPPLASNDFLAQMLSSEGSFDADVDLDYFSQVDGLTRRFLALKWSMLASAAHARADFLVTEQKRIRAVSFVPIAMTPNRPSDSLVNARCDKDEAFVEAMHKATAARALSLAIAAVSEMFMRAIAAEPYMPIRVPAPNAESVGPPEETQPAADTQET